MRTVTLGEYAHVFNGKTPAKGEQRESGHPVLKIRDVDDGGQFRRNFGSFVDKEFVERFQSKQIMAGDTMILNAAHNADYVGSKTFFAGADVEGAIATGEWLIVRPRNDSLDARFASHWITSEPARREIRELVKGIHLYPKDVARLRLPLPPLDEQKRIAAILDQADELRRKRQRAIDRLNQLGQAIFHEMFGDPKSNPRKLPWVKLGKIANFYSGNSLPEGEPFTGQSDGHLLLKVSDLNHDLNHQNIVCSANWSAAPGSRAGTCPPNSLIFPKRGGAIGTNKKRWLRRSAILDPNLMGVHPNDSDITMPFLNGWFQTFNLTDIASGSSVPQLNKQDLAPLEIALPPIAEQLEYARRMELLGRTREGFIRAADHDIQLFSVLQHRAFQGEL